MDTPYFPIIRMCGEVQCEIRATVSLVISHIAVLTLTASVDRHFPLRRAELC